MYYTAKNATGLFVSFLKVNLPACCNLSASCNKVVGLIKLQQLKIRLQALQTCYNLFKQLVPSLWITSFDDQLAASLLTTYNTLVVNKLSQTMRTHPDIGLLITSLLHDVNRLFATCAFCCVI